MAFFSLNCSQHKSIIDQLGQQKQKKVCYIKIREESGIFHNCCRNWKGETFNMFISKLYFSGMTSVYSFGPTFRAENSHTRKHLAEFYMVEAETVMLGERGGMEKLMNLIEELMSSVVTAVHESNEEDVRYFCNEAERSKM